MSSVTLNPTQSCLISSTQVDSTNTPLTTPDPTYGAPVYTNSNANVVTLAGTRAIPTGILGSATITATETSSDSTKPTITGSITLTVVGPSAAALSVSGSVVEGH